MICYYQNKKVISICFLLEVGIKLSIFIIFLKAIFIFQKNIRNILNIIFLFKQTLRDIILLFLDIAGVNYQFRRTKTAFRKAWEKDYGYLQIDRFAKLGKGRYTIRICKKKL